MNLYTSLTLRYLKQNKRRTLVTIIGIILATALICGIGNICTSFMDYQMRNEIQSNGSFYVTFNNIDKEKADIITKSSGVSEYGYKKDLGSIILDKKNSTSIDINVFDKNTINICSVGKIIEKKGYYRLAQIHKKLIDEGLKHNIYVIGIGEDEDRIRKYLKDNKLEDTYHLIGFRDNPYKYVAKCDLFVCSSYREGFSTAVTESLVVGTPVVSTLCSGAQELLGYNNEYGLIVENSEEGIYKGLKKLLEDKELLEYYKKKAAERGSFFSKEKTVAAVEKMLDEI